MKITLSGIFACICFSLSAQFNVGIQASNWGGVSNTIWNPAISDSRYMADISLGGMNSGFVQNYKGLAPSSFYQNASFNNIFGIELLKTDLFSDPSIIQSSGNTSNTVHLSQFAILEGPGSFMFPFGDNKNAIAISYHFNAARTIVGMDPALGLFSEGNPTGAGMGSNQFVITNAAWFDYDVTYGHTVLDKGSHFIKIGATLKILQAVETSTLQASLTNYSFVGSNLEAGSATLSNTYFQGNNISAAGDLGIVYEFRPFKESYRYDIDTFSHLLPRYRNLYTLAVGFAVIDIGALPGISSQTNRTISVNNALFGQGDFNVFDKAPLNTWLQNNISQQGYAGSSTLLMPTRFNLYIDYNSKPGLGVHLGTTISPVFASSSPQIAYGSNITLTPRFDLPLFGVYLPMSYNFIGNPELGFAFRGGPVFVGVADFIGMVKPGGMSNSLVYASVKIPIIFHRKYDKDHDKVSNRYDLCPNEKGTWASHGCADTDMDGIRDSLDQCPTQPGPAYTHGCPDADGDSIPDKDDSCPTVKGPVEFHGCPDTDGDGVPDKYDECPNQKGPKELHGCPDSDGDGVADKYDDCPNVKGDKNHKGCPDSDGDGIYDNEDLCPYEAGPAENKGCPWPDSDGDGILDKDDLCPNQKGLPEYHGCPAPSGKPVGSQILSLYDSLLFESGKADLSLANLQRVKIFAQKMINENKTYNVLLRGHTDDSEADPSVLYGLSVQRAEAVRQVLISQGVELKRITVEGYGSEQPAADNKSLIQRRFNRRVQLFIEVVGGE